MLAALLSSCWSTRGSLGVLAPNGAGSVELLGDRAVIGHACGRGERETRAFQSALAKEPRAQTLTQVELADHGACAFVIGRPARFVEGAAQVAVSAAPAQAYDGTRPEPGKVRLYVYRWDVGKSDHAAEVLLPGVSKVTLMNAANTSLTVAPGRYRGVARRGGQGLALAELVFEPDRVYYLKITDTSAVQPNAVGGAFGLVGALVAPPKVRTSFVVEKREPAFAAAELAWLAMHAEE